MLTVSLMLISIGIVWSWWTQDRFPIAVVSLADKLQYADPALVKEAVATEIERGFFSMRLYVMRDKLLQVPWVVGAQVQRKWPNVVSLKVQERQPLATWVGGGIVDTEAKLFFPPEVVPVSKVQGLPEFQGDKTYLTEMVDVYNRMLAKIKPIGLSVKRLILMPDHGWQAMLDNGVTIMLGQTELDERIKRFVLAYSDQKTGLRNTQVQVIDLRYTNGLAIGGGSY